MKRNLLLTITLIASLTALAGCSKREVSLENITYSVENIDTDIYAENPLEYIGSANGFSIYAKIENDSLIIKELFFNKETYEHTYDGAEEEVENIEESASYKLSFENEKDAPLYKIEQGNEYQGYGIWEECNNIYFINSRQELLSINVGDNITIQKIQGIEKAEYIIGTIYHKYQKENSTSYSYKYNVYVKGIDNNIYAIDALNLTTEKIDTLVYNKNTIPMKKYLKSFDSPKIILASSKDGVPYSINDNLLVQSNNNKSNYPNSITITVDDDTTKFELLTE